MGASEGEPRTIQQAPLASAPGAVIIRRGDTLWQISRRTYGQGVRYTTIYLANRSQIQDPDRIQPGQVFSVPDTPLENAEELHRKRLEGDSLR
jgi:nucleoid-associated protein YgaU